MKNKHNKKGSGKAGVIVWGSVSTFLIVFLLVLTILEYTLLNSIFTTVLGGSQPIISEDGYEAVYTSQYDTKNDVLEAGRELNVRIEEEGAVLLLNENNALPIARGSRVSVFGKNSVNLVLNGTGSGGGGSEGASTIYDGLEAGGLEYNPVLRDFYESSASGSGRAANPALTEGATVSEPIYVGETPATAYKAAVRNSFGHYNDAAIVVISRIGGESFDLPRIQDTDNGGIEGNHYLQLDRNEYDMLDMVTSRFDKVIVLLNTLTSFQCDFIAEYNNTPSSPRIDAVMWIGGPGVNGAEAIGRLLNGEVNPSGKTVDTWYADFTADPTWINFGDNSQVNGNISNTNFLQNGSNVSGAGRIAMVTYEEGVYVGYRYYETRAYEELQEDSFSDWYEKNVIFPYGYGLSYTEFSREITEVEGSFDNGGSVTVTVRVRNTGDVPGKDVIQLYVSKPYTEYGIEKSHIDLVDFAKTEVLEEDGFAEFTFTIDAYDLASYDYNDANGINGSGYELEAGDYVFYVGGSSHIWATATDAETAVVTLDENLAWTEDPVTGNRVENRYTLENDYDDIQYRLSDVWVGDERRKGMSRTDFEGTFPTPLIAEEREVRSTEDVNGYTELTKLHSFAHNNTDISDLAEEQGMPVTGSNESELILHDLVSDDATAFENIVDYLDVRWDELLDRLTFSEMLELVNNGAFGTIGIESIGKNLTNDSDGPIGFVNFMPGISARYTGNPTFATEIVIGSTWNKDLAYQMGSMVGETGLKGDVRGNGLPYTGWYAPAVNLHRSPFAGRNFEYYSEDPVLSGKMAVNVINGAMSKGVITELKHFALNEQETNRGGISTFCTEQALRELYLKPFEIAVKGDDAVCETARDEGYTSYRGTTGVMSSFNRVGNKWAGGDYRLMTQILRNEWGFEGLVISDYKTDNYMDCKQMLYAGNDLILTSLSTYMWPAGNRSSQANAENPEDVLVLRNATKNILYAVANSNSVQIRIDGYHMEWWRALTIALDVIVPVGIGVWGFFAIRKFLKLRKTNS